MTDLLSVEDRVTLVSAMAGYGKTSAIRQWVEMLEVPVAWLSLDLLDQEPMAFWSNVLLAVGAAVPGLDREPAMLLWERGPDDPLFLAALVAGLCDLATPLVLVLDGVSEQVERTVLDGLILLVERAGEVLRTVVIARADPDLPTARWAAIGWLNEIREDTLGLTDDEAVTIAKHTDTAIRDVSTVIALNQRVDRWPIGFHMALLSRPSGRLSAPGDLSIGSSRLLASYLVAEVLEAMSEDEREVALTLCVLQRIDPDMCMQLAGPQASDAVRRLLRRGMFLTVVDPRVGSMRFHDLFRELMETELGYRDPVGRVELHRRAAMLWRERGDLLSAYHHLAVIGEADKARELLMGPTLALVDGGDLEGLHRFARQLPTSQDVTNPNLALDLAVVALYADGTLAARRWCDRAEALLEGATEEVAPRLAALRCTMALLDADLVAALAAIEGHHLYPGAAADVFEQRLPIVAARVMLAARRRTEADEWITLAEHVDGPAIVTEATVPTLRAWYEWMFDSLRRAVVLIDRALGWLDEHDIGHHPLAFDTYITASWCRLATGDLSDAGRLADRAQAEAETLGYAWNQLQAGNLRARLVLITGEPALSLQILDRLRDTISFESCKLFADRLQGTEIEALAAIGRTRDAVALIAQLQEGPRAALLRARFVATTDREVSTLLAGRDSWPVADRIQAEVILNSRGLSPSSAKLVEVLTTCADDGWVLPFLGLGTKVESALRDLPLETLHPRLARTLDFLAPALPADADEQTGVRLTSRELSLVELLPTHLSNAEIGERLFLSVNTVKSNLKSVYRKLDATTRAEAVEAARRSGLI